MRFRRATRQALHALAHGRRRHLGGRGRLSGSRSRSRPQSQQYGTHARVGISQKGTSTAHELTAEEPRNPFCSNQTSFGANGTMVSTPRCRFSRNHWTTQGFKASSRKNLPMAIREGGYVFHGLRKSAVVMLLEAGCTTAEVQAITGQSVEMVEHYAKDVNTRKLAKSGMEKWENASADCKTNCKTLL